MAKQFITHTYEKRNKETKEVKIIETEYRIDADFVPTKQKDICIEFMVNYCKSKGKEDAQWLLETHKEKIKYTNEKGEKKERALSTFEIREKFVKKYFPNIIKEKTKANKREDIIADLLMFINE